MSEIRANTISNLAGTGPATLTGQSAAKAWVNFNGTGTIAARDSFNVASLTDNGTGSYTVSFSNAFGAGDYSAPTGYNGNGANNYNAYASPSAGSTQITMVQWGVAFYDTAVCFLSCHGDLA